MKKFDYKSAYKKFHCGDMAEITFIDNKKALTKEVRINSINDKKISFEDNKTIYECSPAEIKNIVLISTNELPLLQWSLDIIGLICLFSIKDLSQSIASHSIALIVPFLFCAISWRGLIFHPKKNKTTWLFASLIGLGAIWYNIPHASTRPLIIVALIFSALGLFFFWDRSKSIPLKQTPKHDVYFYMGLSLIAYTFVMISIWTQKSVDIAGYVISLCLSLALLASLLVWAHRGWGPKNKKSEKSEAPLIWIPLIILLLLLRCSL